MAGKLDIEGKIGSNWKEVHLCQKMIIQNKEYE